MTNDTTDNSNSGTPNPDYKPDLNAEELCIAAMLRACADGELCPEGCERLKKYLAEHPEAQAQVAFEKNLKGCCDRVMREPVCPDALRAKIHAMAGSAMSMHASNQQTRQKSFWQRSPVMSAMAAVLVIAAGALIWQSSSLISKGGGLGISETTPVAYAERIGNFVAREHMRCCDEKAAAQKLVIDDVDQTTSYFSEKFAKPVVSPVHLEDGSQIRFYGGGDCHVPATNSSGHLRFDAVGPEGQVVPLSLFIAPDPGFLGIEEGVTYVLNSTKCSEQGANLFAWVSGGVMYLLVSEADETMCSSVRGMMNAPAEVRKL
tara:strand:- start:3815 stop:4768 length:954 start_codon:yes stop_codon:yes gene_type:complete